MVSPTGPKSVIRATAGVVSIAVALIVIPIGFVLIVTDTRTGGGVETLVRPLAALTVGGGLLACGIALLIWEMSVRYGIRR
jgi:hypothetical protein